METELECYHAHISQPCRTVVLLMKLAKIPYKEKVIDLIKRDNMTPGFLALNPFQKVPVIVRGDFVLTESRAIAKYILNTVQFDDNWYPADVEKRAMVDEYLSYHPTGVRRVCRGVAQNFFIREQLTGKPIPQEEKETAYADFLEVVTGFENYFLKRGPFIIGDEISIADLFAVPEIIQAQLSGRDFLSDRPKLKEWMERVKKETSPHFEDVHKIIYEIIATRVE